MIESKRVIRLAYAASVMCASLTGVVRSADRDDFDPWTQPARYELEQRVHLGEWVGSTTGPVHVWLPIPIDDASQRVLSLKIESPWSYRQTKGANGNRFIYLELNEQDLTDGDVVLRAVVERWPYTGVQNKKTKADVTPDPLRFLGTQRRIPLTGRIKEYAEQAGAGLFTDAARIRAYYDFVIRTMKYAKDGEGWGRGDASWACESRYGNCTDFHSVLIGMCRSEGIPARFVIGFPIPPDAETTPIKGYHCWAEAYDRASGWVPMDASEAWKSKRFDDYYGQLPADRIAFTAGRDLILEPPQHGEPLNYFIYPYAEVGGKPADAIPWTLWARRIKGHGRSANQGNNSGPARSSTLEGTAQSP